MTFSFKKSTFFQKLNSLKQWFMFLFKDDFMKYIGWFGYTK